MWLNYNYFHSIYGYFEEYALEAEGKNQPETTVNKSPQKVLQNLQRSL